MKIGLRVERKAVIEFELSGCFVIYLEEDILFVIYHQLKEKLFLPELRLVV